MFFSGQIIWRHIQKAGLVTKYGVDKDFNINIRAIKALAFLQPEEIPDAFIMLEKTFDDDTNAFIEWFKNDYVLGRIKKKKSNTTQERCIPFYAPKLWSVYESTYTDVPRTQNKLEAWHRRFQVIVGKKHVGLYSLLKSLKNESLEMAKNYMELNNGAPKKKMKRLYQSKEDRIKNIIRSRTERTTLNFIMALAHNLGLN